LKNPQPQISQLELAINSRTVKDWGLSEEFLVKINKAPAIREDNEGRAMGKHYESGNSGMESPSWRVITARL